MQTDRREDLVLQSDELRVAVSPAFGGSVTAITQRATSLDVLWSTSWADIAMPVHDRRPLGVLDWVRHSRGGWQIVGPNGGDEALWDGVQHGFHGEASTAGWTVERMAEDGTAVDLSLQLEGVELSLTRAISIEGNRVTVSDVIENTASAAIDIMWTQHPGLGGALLDGPCRIDTNARAVRLDDAAPVVGIAAVPGDVGRWPYIGHGDGVDLRMPIDGSAMLGYLSEFDGDPWVQLSRADGSIGARLEWDAALYPYCWMWQELGGTVGEPWNGAARVIGLEPATSWPGQGLAQVAAKTGTVVRIEAGSSVRGAVSLTVFGPDAEQPRTGLSPQEKRD